MTVGELVETGAARLAELVSAAPLPREPAIDVALQNAGSAGHAGDGAQFGEAQRPALGQCAGAAQRVLAIGGDDRPPGRPAGIEVAAAADELAQQQRRGASRGAAGMAPVPR